MQSSYRPSGLDTSACPLFPPAAIGSEGKWVLFATILSSSMSFLDSTVVNVAFRPPARLCPSSRPSRVVDAYVLTLTAFILLGGSFGDIFGRRRALRLGLVVFTTGSMLCGLAPTLFLLDVARGIQGIGGALLVPSSLAILTASFDPSERGRAIGLWASLGDRRRGRSLSRADRRRNLVARHLFLNLDRVVRLPGRCRRCPNRATNGRCATSTCRGGDAAVFWRADVRAGEGHARMGVTGRAGGFAIGEWVRRVHHHGHRARQPMVP
jgi:hypothetical protein